MIFDLAGTTTLFAGTFFTTTDPAPIWLLSPIFISPNTTELAHTETLSPITGSFTLRLPTVTFVV